MQCEDNRQRSFFTGRKLWPHPINEDWQATPQTLAANGFYFDPVKGERDSDNVTCYICKKSLDGWEPSDDPAEEHKSHSSQCALVVLKNKRVSSKKKQEARLTTFGDHWPHDNKNFIATSENMAEAGFIYVPTKDSNDMVQCPDCKLALDGWEEADDPLEEHAKRGDVCPFIKANLKKKPRRNKTVTESDTSVMFSESSTVLDESTIVTDKSSILGLRRSGRKRNLEISDSSMVTTSDISIASTASKRGKKKKEPEPEISTENLLDELDLKSRNTSRAPSPVEPVPREETKSKRKAPARKVKATKAPSATTRKKREADAVGEEEISETVHEVSSEEVPKTPDAVEENSNEVVTVVKVAPAEVKQASLEHVKEVSPVKEAPPTAIKQPKSAAAELPFASYLEMTVEQVLRALQEKEIQRLARENELILNMFIQDYKDRLEQFQERFCPSQ